MKHTTVSCDFCGKRVDHPREMGSIDFVKSGYEDISKADVNGLHYDACASCRYKLGNYIMSQTNKLKKEERE